MRRSWRGNVIGENKKLCFGRSEFEMSVRHQVEILCKSTVQAFLEKTGARERYLGVLNMYVVLRPCKRIWFSREKCRERS